MIKRLLPLALSFALAVSPVSEAFASVAQADIPGGESITESVSLDESLSDLMDASFAEEDAESGILTAEEPEETLPEQAEESLSKEPEETLPEQAEESLSEETEEAEFTSGGFIFRKRSENEAALVGTTEELGEIAVPETVSDGEAEYTVTAVEKDALSGESAEKISLPASVKEFGSQDLPELGAIEADESSETFRIVDGALYTVDEEGRLVLVLYPAAAENETFVVPEGTAEIAEGAFSSSRNLSVIVIGKDVEKIEAGAFSGLKENVRIAFLREDAGIELGEGAFLFESGNNGELCFVSEDILNEILGKYPDFALECQPAEEAEDESAEETAEEEDQVPAFTFRAEGIPEDILALLADEEESELTAEEEPAFVAAGEDAGIARGIYQLTNTYRRTRLIYSLGGRIKASYKINGDQVIKRTDTFFEIVPTGAGRYALINFENGKAVTLESAAPAEGAAAVDGDYTGADTQKWYIRTLNDETGSVEIVSVLDENYRLEIKGDAAAAGTDIVLQKRDESSKQGWVLEKQEGVKTSLETGYYTISAYKDKNIVVETADGSTSNGANIQLGKNTGASYQQFKITSLGYGNYYTIENVRSGLVWDVAGGSKKSGANIQQYKSNGTTAQIFRVIETEEGGEKVYQFIGKASGLAVDYAGAAAKAGTNVRLYTSNNSAGQKWFLKKQDRSLPGTDAGVTAGYYKIISPVGQYHSLGILNAVSKDGLSAVMCLISQMEGTIFEIRPTKNERYTINVLTTGKALTYADGYAEPLTDIVQRGVAGSSTEWYIRKKSPSDTAYMIIPASNPQVVMDLTGAMARTGQNVRLYTNNGSKAQTWILKGVSYPYTHVIPNGIYSIANMNKTSMVLAVAGGDAAAGGNLVISAKTGTAPNQLFKVEAIGSSGNEYKITNVWSGLSLDVAGGSKSSGANLQQYAWNNSTAQRFKIVQVMGGSNPCYKLVGVGGGKVIDVQSGRTAEGTNVRMYDYNASNAQLWQFNKVTSISTVVTGTPVNFTSKVSSSYKLGWKSASDGLATQKDSKSVAQAFRIETVSSGVYRIYNLGNGGYLTANGSGVKFDAWGNKDTQKWQLKATGDGDYSFYIVSKSSGNYLTSLSAITDGGGVWLAAGNASNAKKFVLKPATIRSGWVQIDDNWRYYNNDGNFLRDQYFENGKYYFNSQGYAGKGWAKYGAYYYYYDGRNGRQDSDARPYLSALFGTKLSRDGYNCPNCVYHLSVDTAYPCQITVYTTYPGTSGWNLPIFSFLCSPGTSDASGRSITIYGDRRAGDTSRWQELMGPSYGQYATVIETWTQIAGSNFLGWTNTGQYIHSVACGQPNNHNLDPNVYNLLGTRQSHGCVRVPVRYAYWIYEFVERNQGIGVGQNLARPMKTLRLPRAVDAVDPTDPAYTGNYGYLDNNNYQHWNGQFLN